MRRATLGDPGRPCGTPPPTTPSVHPSKDVRGKTLNLALGERKRPQTSAFTLQSHRPQLYYYTMRSAPMSARLSSRQHVGALRPAARAGSATSRPRIVAVRAEKVVGIDLGTTNSAVRARRPAVVPCAAPPPFLVLAAPSARSPGAAPGAGCCYGGRQAYHCEQRRGRAHHP